jgi:hypothetical protein
MKEFVVLYSTSQTFQGALLLPVSSPDVVGTLTPTVTAALVDAVSTLWRVKKPTLTHRPFSINSKYKPGFLLFHTVTQKNSFSLQTFQYLYKKQKVCRPKNF